MKKILLPLLLVAIGATAYFMWRRAAEQDAHRVAGVFEARTIEVGSLVGGRVAAVESAAGRHVEAGAVLVRLETDLVDLELAQQRARVARAQAEVDRAQRGPRDEDLQRSRIAYEAAQTDRGRFEQLWKDGVVGRRDFDQALVTEATARQTYLERARGSRSEDLAAAVATLDGEEQRQAYIERQRTELTVRSPAAGVVEVLDLRPGDLVAPNAPVASILEDGQLWLRAFVPETRLAAIRVGQELDFEVDGRPGETFRGTVVEIADRGEYTPRNLQTFEQRQDLVFAVRILPLPVGPSTSAPTAGNAGQAASAAIDPTAGNPGQAASAAIDPTAGRAGQAASAAIQSPASGAIEQSPFKAGMSAVVHLKDPEPAR